eukprot:7088790-Karenia_brevis.AAC.1
MMSPSASGASASHDGHQFLADNNASCVLLNSNVTSWYDLAQENMRQSGLQSNHGRDHGTPRHANE